MGIVRAIITGAAVVAMACGGRISAREISTGADVQSRLTADIDAGNPVTIHVVVALCDNRYQGIVPVPQQLGNGQDPANNLYWGAMYGVRSFLTRSANWAVVEKLKPSSDSILQKIVLYKQINRDTVMADVYVVAEAWDGRYIREATMRFLDMAGEARGEAVRLQHDSDLVVLQAGGRAHLVCYVGHNGLMDFAPNRRPVQDTMALHHSAVVLACASKAYFEQILNDLKAHGLLLTTGLMAPEAYTLNAVIQSWVSGATSAQSRNEATAAYSRYQKCSIEAARRLFYSAP